MYQRFVRHNRIIAIQTLELRGFGLAARHRNRRPHTPPPPLQTEITALWLTALTFWTAASLICATWLAVGLGWCACRLLWPRRRDTGVCPYQKRVRVSLCI